jgi:hypothetical protein
VKAIEKQDGWFKGRQYYFVKRQPENKKLFIFSNSGTLYFYFAFSAVIINIFPLSHNKHCLYELP